MKTARSLTLCFVPFCVTLALATAASAQQPASAFDRGNSLQVWQHPDYAGRIAQCSKPPAPFRIGRAGASTSNEEPQAPVLPAAEAIPGIVDAGTQWQLVWAWQGNNADGPIAGEDGTLLIANQDASNVMALDPRTSLAEVIYDDTNTGGAVSRSKNGALFLAMRGLGSGVLQLEPERRIFADTMNGEPFDCTGGVVNDIAADAKGGVYIAVSGAGVYYADSTGTITGYGTVANPNGIILSPDESILYVTNGPMLVAFDVQADGALANQRDFAPLSGGGDGSAVDSEGRIYVAAGSAVNVITAQGELLGVIPGPEGLHGVAFGGAGKGTLFGIVFYGDWGTPSARNQVVALDVLTQGYEGRAK
ncbi:MAG TPA: SMP-30/gluconolactonase/LRE family protein [Pseudomonadales bacterium]